MTSGSFLSAFCLRIFLQYVATYCILIWSVKIILIGMNRFSQKMFHKNIISVISGIRHEVAENCALLDYYAANNGTFLPMFRDNLSVPSSGFNNSVISYRLFSKKLPLVAA